MSDVERFKFREWSGRYADPGRGHAAALWTRESTDARPVQQGARLAAAICLGSRPKKHVDATVGRLLELCGDPGPSRGGTMFILGVMVSGPLIAATLPWQDKSERVLLWASEPFGYGFQAVVIGALDDSWRLTIAPCVTAAPEARELLQFPDFSERPSE